MKTIPFKLLLFFFMLPGLLMAEGIKGKYVKEKKINKSFVVNPDAMTSIANKYGNVYVTTWDENKTEIDVVITVAGNNEEQVIKRINSIDIAFDATKGKVSAITQFGSSSNSRTNMDINYTVKIPKRGSISVANQYGGISLGSINGSTYIDSQYGTFSAGDLSSEDNVISLQYSDGSNINYIAKGYVNAQYSGLNIKKSNLLNIKASYTDVKVSDVGNLTYSLDYGDMKIGNANIVLGTGDYTGLKFGSISTELFIKTDYSDIKVDNIGKGTKKVTITSTYTNIDLGLSENFACDFEFTLSYGNLSGLNGLTFTEEKKKNNDAYYKGYYRNTGVSRMLISTEYGNINLRKN